MHNNLGIPANFIQKKKICPVFHLVIQKCHTGNIHTESKFFQIYP